MLRRRRLSTRSSALSASGYSKMVWAKGRSIQLPRFDHGECRDGGRTRLPIEDAHLPDDIAGSEFRQNDRPQDLRVRA